MKWSLRLTHQSPQVAVTLRSLRRRDSRRWHELRRSNAGWLRPWEATLPMADPNVPATFGGMIRGYRRDALAGRSLSLGIDVDSVLMGQITLGGIAWGSLRSAYIGYWISQEVAGRGVMPTAVAMLMDHAFGAMALHRVEINIRPENRASLRVVEKLGIREEGRRPRYLHIDGDWRDHVSYVMTAETWPAEGVLARWERDSRQVPPQQMGTDQHKSDTPEVPERGRTVRDTGDSLPTIQTPRP